ncbi:hypothetical protein DL98DRAFT_524916 [Cadophora sp. DSE1049]|nr:hypothetical protein DL98DRAFT_524916 [Cadophora sp. DSE1049]
MPPAAKQIRKINAASRSIGAIQTMPPSTEPAIPPHLLKHLNKAINEISSHLRADPSLSSSQFPNLSKQSSHLPQFPKFSKLPLELRLMIWRFAGVMGQVIDVKTLPRLSRYGLINCTGTAVRCSLLLACKEARQEVLKSKINLGRCIYEWEPNIYINCGVDTLWFQGSRQLRSLATGMFHFLSMVGDKCREIQSVAVDYRLLDPCHLSSHKNTWDWLYRLKNLKELIFIVGYHNTSAPHGSSMEPTHQQHGSGTAFTDATEQELGRWYRARRPSTLGSQFTWKDAAAIDQKCLKDHYAMRVRHPMTVYAPHGLAHPAETPPWRAPQIRFVNVVGSGVQINER